MLLYLAGKYLYSLPEWLRNETAEKRMEWLSWYAAGGFDISPAMMEPPSMPPGGPSSSSQLPPPPPPKGGAP